MKKQDFKLTFLSDVVLNGSSNTEGKIENLDYITGSSILGIVAKKYDEFKNPFDIFHSGKVRFGEGTPLINEQISFKIPFCFFEPKLKKDKSELYNNHFVDYSKLLNKQLKQVRKGYITLDKTYFTLDYNYSQKAAYDKENRRAKDSSMFGYSALKKGLSWKFTVSFDENFIDIKNQESIIDILKGKHYLGKSKSSEYGQVQIEPLILKDQNIESFEERDISYIYINSSLALYDENLLPTFKPSSFNLNLDRATINWEQTQIRTKTFTPHNYKRGNKDSSRLVIEKGSIIALNNASKNELQNLKKGLGLYLSEGYGEVLVNPDFLLKKDAFSYNVLNTYDKEEFLYKFIENDLDIKRDDNLIDFLKQRQNALTQVKDLGTDVQEYIKTHKNKYEKVSKSQWGQIRMMVQVNSNNYEEDILTFIKKGKSTKQWENALKEFETILKNQDIEFIKLLSMQMPKVKWEDS